MSINNSFAPAANQSNRFSRKFAGSTTDSVDPYISGYFFVNFSYLPAKLVDFIRHSKGNDGIGTTAEVKNLLAASCLSVTMPGATVNKAEFTGLGGIRWSVPSNVEFDNTVTLRFLEYSSLPLLAIFHGWTRMIRDYRAGVSPLKGNEYTKSEYSGTMYYWTTKPDGHTVEYFACLTGLFPMKDPTDQYGGDITTYDKLEVDIDFNVDYVWHEEWVKTRCQAESIKYYDTAWGGLTGGKTIDKYPER